MPPKIRYSKAELLHAAFSLTREQGIGAINARAVARKLGCSTQPIFRAFASMEDVKAEMIRMAADVYAQYLARAAVPTKKPYLAAGMAFLAFADEEPELFKLLFMRDRVCDGTMDEAQDETSNRVVDLVARRTGLPREQAQRFHELFWIFTHGLATTIATRYVSIPRERMEQLLTDEFSAMCKLFGLPENAEYE